jgi:hypothetical protein
VWPFHSLAGSKSLDKSYTTAKYLRLSPHHGAIINIVKTRSKVICVRPSNPVSGITVALFFVGQGGHAKGTHLLAAVSVTGVPLNVITPSRAPERQKLRLLFRRLFNDAT